MKKHILGFALFSFIFMAFAIAFAYFYVPQLPQIAIVGEKNYVKEVSVIEAKPTFCNKQRKDLIAEVVGSQYFVKKNKLISEVKLVWGGDGEPPKKVSVTTMVSGLDKSHRYSFGTAQIIENPFETENEKTFTLISRGGENWDTWNMAKDKNLYVVSGISVYQPGEQSDQQNLSEKKAVVINW
jgi:hypothetical protein